GLLDKAELIGAAKVIAANVGEGDVQQLRALSDRIRAAIGSGVVVLGGVREGKPNLVIAVTKDLVTIVDADELVKEVQGIIDGRGGGRPESASAGGLVSDRFVVADALRTAFASAEHLARAERVAIAIDSDDMRTHHAVTTFEREDLRAALGAGEESRAVREAATDAHARATAATE